MVDWKKLIFFMMTYGVAFFAHAESVRQPVAIAAEELIYLQPKTLTSEYTLALNKIKNQVLVQNKRYVIELSALSVEQKRVAKEQFKTLFGVSFETDWLMVGQYNGAIMYSLLSGLRDPLVTMQPSKPGTQAYPSPSFKVTNEGTPYLPHVAFYLQVHRPITEEECRFPVAWADYFKRNSEQEYETLCNNANIALIYRVNLMRSLPLVNSKEGAPTPDAKLVRISLDEQSSGAGIHLNTEVSEFRRVPSHPYLIGWAGASSSSVIAKDYTFSITPSNRFATLLKTNPMTNVNSQYQRRDLSGFEIGVKASGGIMGNKPQGGLDVSYSYSQSRTLVYNTADYRIVRSAPYFPDKGQQIQFRWEREQYPDAASMLNKSTSHLFDQQWPLDTSRINPLSYTGFVPNFDVIYQANPDTNGSTTFTIDSSVNLWSITSAIYKQALYWSYQAGPEWQQYRRISAVNTFTVDWSHPVFTGMKPVLLQSGFEDNQCLSTFKHGEKNYVHVETCNLQSVQQSFFYDEYRRYVSAANAKLCLTDSGTQFLELAHCDVSQRQQWTWDKEQRLKNGFTENLISIFVQGRESFEILRIDNGKNAKTLRLASLFQSGHPFQDLAANIFKN